MYQQYVSFQSTVILRDMTVMMMAIRTRKQFNEIKNSVSKEQQFRIATSTVHTEDVRRSKKRQTKEKIGQEYLFLQNLTFSFASFSCCSK